MNLLNTIEKHENMTPTLLLVESEIMSLLVH